MVGIDEAGRGPIAGPIVVAAVVLPVNCTLKGLDDSKVLSERKRSDLEQEIRDVCVALAIVKAEHFEIDEAGIGIVNQRLFRESFDKLRKAMKERCITPEFVAVDGRPSAEFPIEHEYVTDGDARVKSVAAASILAKTYRDRLMIEYHKQFPGYGFADHKGYGTSSHWAAIDRLGACPIHRKSFLVKYQLRKNQGSLI